MSPSSGLSTRGPARPDRLALAARQTAWTLATWAAVQLAAIVLGKSALAMVALQAGAAEWGAGKLAVTWSDPLAPPPAGRDLWRRFGVGSAWGGAAALLVVGLALATGRGSVQAEAPAVGALAIGVLPAGLAAVRDELLLRGMVSRIGRGLGGPLGAALLCACASAAARTGAPAATVLAVGVEALRGLSLGFVWARDRGAWMAVGASAAWIWMLDTVTRGDLLDIRLRAGEPAASPEALVVAGLMAACAAWWAWPRPASPGRGG